MSKQTVFKGAFTAIVTPFTADNAVDLAKLRELVDWQIGQGIGGLVPCGTTGESPTLTMDEHVAVMRTVIEETRRRVPVIAGTGSNNTAESVFLTEKAAALKADGALVIMPYYNKPMPAGQFLHFKTVCEAGRIPVVVYNVPSRTAKRIEAEDLARMYREIDLVVGVKDAVGDIEFTCKTRSLCDIPILSGDDSMTFPMIAVGGQGVISVASNVAPAAVTAMVKAATAGDFAAARRMHYELWDLFKGLFIETNPIPVKTALELMGRANGRLRLPLSAIEDKNLAKLQAVLRTSGLIR